MGKKNANMEVEDPGGLYHCVPWTGAKGSALLSNYCLLHGGLR